jgi:hypothetical protein
MDPYDQAFKAYLDWQGAQNPQIFAKELYGPGEWHYTVMADGWKTPSPYNTGAVRHVLVRTDGNGTASYAELVI